VRTGDLAGAWWRKSSHSSGGGEQTDCVELAELAGQVAMRDSKDPDGRVLVFPRGRMARVPRRCPGGAVRLTVSAGRGHLAAIPITSG
jgi:hypothetical protein